VTDPNCKIAVVLQRTRYQGILTALPPVNAASNIFASAKIQAGDEVETAGLGGFFPKGIPVGRISRVWKEPGQIYQVAQVELAVDLGQVEEVELLDIH